MADPQTYSQLKKSEILGQAPEDWPHVILIHNDPDIIDAMADLLVSNQFHPHVFTDPQEFLEEWKNSSSGIKESTGIIVHLDIGKGGIMNAQELFNELNKLGGEHLRTVLESGGFYGGRRVTSQIAVNLGADLGYDPHSGYPRLIPDYIIRYLRLGKISQLERDSYRGRLDSFITTEFETYNRIQEVNQMLNPAITPEGTSPQNKESNR